MLYNIIYSSKTDMLAKLCANTDGYLCIIVLKSKGGIRQYFESFISTRKMARGHSTITDNSSRI